MVRLSLIPATVFVMVMVLVGWTCFTNPPPIDFVSFWKGSRLILDGKALAAYQYQPSTYGRLMPLAYPPPFLLAIAPLALVGFGIAFLIWILVTGSLYLAASGAPRRFAWASPPALSNGMVGQNGFLTAAIFLGGFRLLATRPWLGGMILGLMVIKPQLAVMVPIALIAGRHWTAVWGAAVSAALSLAIAALLLGPRTYPAFIDVLARYSILLKSGRWPWNELASIFAVARWLGAAEGVAFAIHFGVALASAVLVSIAWRNKWEAKVAIVAAASLLVSPYLFTYDAVLLVAPMAWLAVRRPGWAAATWCLALLPLLRSFGYAGPNGIALAASLSLVALVVDQRRCNDPLAPPQSA